MKSEEGYEGLQALAPHQWNVNPATGIITLTEESLKQILNPDSFEKWYILDPEPLAKGQYAVVHHCYHRVTGVEYAAKFSSRWRLGSDCSADIIHEIAVCAMLKPTARTVQLVDVFSTTREMVLVMEYAPGGDLQTLLDEDIVPFERDVVAFLRQLLETLVFIHDKKIVHLDIKPQNLVLMGEFPDCDVKLCDFEISRMLTDGEKVREILGTPDYVAPEILHYEPITTRTDMWSVGVLTYVLLTGFLPFGGDTDQETFLEISKCDLDFPPQLFEDITPDAIDFMQKLLIRQPERRMNARECLNHDWIKKDFKRPTPPSSLNLTSINMPAKASPMKEIEENIVEPILERSRSSPGHNSIEKSVSCPLTGSSESLEKTPDQNQLPYPLTSVGRPPLHPSVSQRSVYGELQSTSCTPVTTPGSLLSCPFLYRQEMRASRQNLERLKSLSKSREVISGKIQMTSLKKSQSKSRERLFGLKLGDSRSREQLNALRSLSQSVEALTALSMLNKQADELFMSCNNIYQTKSPSHLLPHDDQGRMYQSLADINRIDDVSIPRYYDSTVSLNTDIYNDLLTQKNTDFNCVIGETRCDSPRNNRSPSGLRASSCRGGRESTTDSKISKTQRAPEAQRTQKISRISKADKMKKDAQKRRKERKDKEKREEQQKEKLCRDKPRSASVSDVDIGKARDKVVNASSPTFRRGSVSHVEQRLQERHERQQEKKQREERRKSTSRRPSTDLDRSPSSEKPKPLKSSLSTSTKSKNKTVPKRNRIRKTGSPFSSDVSQASSLESVEASLDSPNYHTPTKRFIVPEVRVISDSASDTPKTVESLSPCSDENEVLEETIKRLVTTESQSSDSDKTITENKDDTSESSDDQGAEQLSVSEKIQNFEKVSSTSIRPPILKRHPHFDPHLLTAERLDIISEEDSSSERCDSRIEFRRSNSNTSDLGSSASDVSSSIGDRDDKARLFETLPGKEDFNDAKSRNRSCSVHSRSIDAPKLVGRSRSNSCHIAENLQGRPWGTLCSGSVARAFEKFNLRETDISPSTVSH